MLVQKWIRGPVCVSVCFNWSLKASAVYNTNQMSNTHTNPVRSAGVCVSFWCVGVCIYKWLHEKYAHKNACTVSYWCDYEFTDIYTSRMRLSKQQ